ncbi:MAG: DUF3293 domain-containing protein [Acidobacteriota bacterium]|nr:DUF3293 domain-containing protein [Acidobacteriota bacterium]
MSATRMETMEAAVIDQDLLDAYRQTTYRAELPAGEINLRIGELNPVLERFLAERQINEWAFVTAHNPGSRPLDEAENFARHQALVADMRAVGHVLFEGAGVGDDKRWPAERSLLIFGIKRDEAATLGRKYGQNAIVVGARGNAPELLIISQAS